MRWKQKVKTRETERERERKLFLKYLFFTGKIWLFLLFWMWIWMCLSSSKILASIYTLKTKGHNQRGDSNFCLFSHFIWHDDDNFVVVCFLLFVDTFNITIATTYTHTRTHSWSVKEFKKWGKKILSRIFFKVCVYT